MKKIIRNIFSNKKKAILFISAAIATLVILALLILLACGDNTDYVYKETQVEKGDLTVGVTESGSVTIGTVDQTFDIDMSAFEASSSSSSSSQSGFKGGMFPGMGSSNSSSSSDKDYSRALDVEEVYVTVGQKISKGDALFKLTKDSVASIKDELVADEASAGLTLEKLKNDQKQSRLTATHTKETSEAYAQLAQHEYNIAVTELKDALEDKQKEIDENTETYADNKAKLEELQAQLIVAKNVLENAEYAVKNADTTVIYEYAKQEDARDTAKSQVDNLENEVESLEDENEELLNHYNTELLELNQLKRDLETGTIEANKTYQERITTGKDAAEEYAVTVGYLDADLLDAQNDYEEAMKKLEEFDTYIVDDTVYAEYNGVITDVNIAESDSLSSSQTLITLNNQDDTTISVVLSGDDMGSIDKDSKVNLSISAYPDTIFEGTIDDIGDAVTDSSTGEITYEVTVLIGGDVSGLFEGMTGEVTFITKETKEVTYVSNRAIIREGTKSYVKRKGTSGNIVQKEITTGFSDGVNVEIVEGLSEGDTVLIESKVSE